MARKKAKAGAKKAPKKRASRKAAAPTRRKRAAEVSDEQDEAVVETPAFPDDVRPISDDDRFPNEFPESDPPVKDAEDAEDAGDADDEPEEKPVETPKEKPKKRGRPPSKVKEATKALQDSFSAFAAKAQKTWPGTVEVASKAEVMKVPRISSGVLGVDIATFGGFPRGRFTRIYGREKAGKTGTCLNTVAHWQHQHCGVCYESGPCANDCPFHGAEGSRPKAGALWIDAEHRLAEMWGWVEGHGVDRSRLIYQVPPDGQHIVDFVDSALREHGAGIGLIVVDSIAHVTSQQEIKKAAVKGKTMAVNAQLIASAIRKWTSSICALGVESTRKPTVLLINQIRHSLESFGAPEIQPGGKSLDFAAALDLRLRRRDYHYLVHDPVSDTYEDKTVGFNSRWRPPQDAIPDYVEVDYRVTQSGVCPHGRYGQFKYWLRNAHGRRIGSPDNADMLWSYVRRYNLIERGTGGYTMFDVMEKTQTVLKQRFYADAGLQSKVWQFIVENLMQE